MQKTYFIGTDVSKHTLDIAFIVQGQSDYSKIVWKQFGNAAAGLQSMQKWLGEMNVPLSE